MTVENKKQLAKSPLWNDFKNSYAEEKLHEQMALTIRAMFEEEKIKEPTYKSFKENYEFKFKETYEELCQDIFTRIKREFDSLGFDEVGITMDKYMPTYQQKVNPNEDLRLVGMNIEYSINEKQVKQYIKKHKKEWKAFQKEVKDGTVSKMETDAYYICLFFLYVNRLYSDIEGVEKLIIQSINQDHGITIQFKIKEDIDINI